MTDDTNGSTLDGVKAIYEYCMSRGILPTRTVWTQRASRRCGIRNNLEPRKGMTLEDAEYTKYCQELNQRGIEFALHDVSPGNNVREDVIRGLETFKQTFGYDPSIYICHAHNAEHPYWGEEQYRSPIARRLARLFYRFKPEEFSGHIPTSPYYWSDICRERIRYVRLYRTRHLNVLRKNPGLPYHQYDKPDVRFWFSGSAEDYELLERVTPEALDRIARQDGAIIHYAHTSVFLDPEKSTASGLRPAVESALDLIGKREDCWSPTVTSILDRCLATKNLLVQKQKHALVITNPTEIALDDFQFEARYPVLHLGSGEALYPDRESRFHIDRLEPLSCVVLYFQKEAAEVGDPVGVPRFEEFTMAFEEARRQVWKVSVRKLIKWWRESRLSSR